MNLKKSPGQSHMLEEGEMEVTAPATTCGFQAAGRRKVGRRAKNTY